LRTRPTFGSQLSVLLLAACASGSGTASSNPPSTPASQAGRASVETVRWTGSFQPIQQQSGSLTPRGTNKTYGSVTLSRARSGPTRTRAEINLTTGLTTSALLHWAIAPSRCGAADLPLLGVDQFPPIEISNSGQGRLDGEVPLTVPTAGTYHIDIYWGNGQDRSDVMACANVKMGS
jgi:membrane-bound lytic murein transglycosylase